MQIIRYILRNDSFPNRIRSFPVVVVLSSVLLALSACVADPMAVNEALQTMPDFSLTPPPGIQRLQSTTESTPEATPNSAGEEQSADAAADAGQTERPLVTVKNRSVNIRSGPGLNYQVIFGAREGDVFETAGKTEDGWWRICCVPGPNDQADEPTVKAWISDRVVTPNEAAAALEPLHPLFPDDLEAIWDVNYECRSERCTIKMCTAEVTTAIRNNADPRWLEIDRKVQWENACGENSTWLHQIDRLDGRERYPNSTGLFLFDYWVGANPGPANSLFTMPDGRQVKAWCSDEQTAEIAEANGWTNVYEGVTCYDVRTGTLLSMSYTKRWLFTGEYEGETYERAYFGDYEVYDVSLRETNIELAFEEEAP